MEKKDLKAGYTLEDEKGRKWYLFQFRDGLQGKLIENRMFKDGVNLDVQIALNDDLTIKNRSMHPACDIVKVYGLATYLFSVFAGDYDYVEVLWKREKPKTKVTLELTDEQVKSLKEQGII